MDSTRRFGMGAPVECVLRDAIRLDTECNVFAEDRRARSSAVSAEARANRALPQDQAGSTQITLSTVPSKMVPQAAAAYGWRGACVLVTSAGWANRASLPAVDHDWIRVQLDAPPAPPTRRSQAAAAAEVRRSTCKQNSDQPAIDVCVI